MSHPPRFCGWCTGEINGTGHCTHCDSLLERALEDGHPITRQILVGGLLVNATLPPERRLAVFSRLAGRPVTEADLADSSHGATLLEEMLQRLGPPAL